MEHFSPAQTEMGVAPLSLVQNVREEKKDDRLSRAMRLPEQYRVKNGKPTLFVDVKVQPLQDQELGGGYCNLRSGLLKLDFPRGSVQTMPIELLAVLRGAKQKMMISVVRDGKPCREVAEVMDYPHEVDMTDEQRDKIDAALKRYDEDMAKAAAKKPKSSDEDN